MFKPYFLGTIKLGALPLNVPRGYGPVSSPCAPKSQELLQQYPHVCARDSEHCKTMSENIFVQNLGDLWAERHR